MEVEEKTIPELKSVFHGGSKCLSSACCLRIGTSRF